MSGCSDRHHARGLCVTHYEKARRTGQLASLPRINTEERDTRNAKILAAAASRKLPSRIARDLGIGRNVIAGIIYRYGFIPYTPQRDLFPPRGGCLYPSHHDVCDPAFYFCGAPALPGGSWCRAHRRIVFTRSAPAPTAA